jgi:hypothetical protein
VSLSALEVEQLDGDGLRAQARPDLVVDVPLVDGAEAALADEVGHGEVPGDGAQVGDGEGVQVGPRQRQRQVRRRSHPAQLGEGHPALQRPRLLPAAAPRRRRHLLLLLLLFVPAGGGGGVGGGAEAAEQRGPRRPRHASWRSLPRALTGRFGRTRRGIYTGCDAVVLACFPGGLIACDRLPHAEWGVVGSGS